MTITCGSCGKNYEKETGKRPPCRWSEESPARSILATPMPIIDGRGEEVDFDLSGARLEFDLGIVQDGESSLFFSCSVKPPRSTMLNIFATTSRMKSGIVVRVDLKGLEEIQSMLDRAREIFERAGK